MIATMTANSVNRSVRSPLAIGSTSGRGSGSRPTMTPTAVNPIATEMARPRSSRGSTAAVSRPSPPTT